MKTICSILFIALFSITQVSYAQWWGKGVKGNGEVTTEKRSTQDYDAIDCSGFMDFKLVPGSEGNITIEAESNLIEYIITEVKNNTLIVKVENDVNLKPSNNKPLVITIPYDVVNRVSLSGSGDVWNEGVIYNDSFSTSVSGSGDVVLNIEANTTNANVTGSGDLSLKGTTVNLAVSVTGSGDFHGFDLNSMNVDATVTGSGDINVNCKGELKARVTGSGDIEYRGNPTKEDTKVTGSGSIQN
jgi:hypothetical protein